MEERGVEVNKGREFEEKREKEKKKMKSEKKKQESVNQNLCTRGSSRKLIHMMGMDGIWMPSHSSSSSQLGGDKDFAWSALRKWRIVLMPATLGCPLLYSRSSD